MGLKIAVVGAGSTYTPELVDSFVRRADRLPVDETWRSWIRISSDWGSWRASRAGSSGDRAFDEIANPALRVTTRRRGAPAA